jgi:DNA-binding transcriptional regulator YhcF (GntR family)
MLSMTAVLALVEEWELAMERGLLRMGQAMPKVRSFAQERHLSHNTVVQALQLLVEKGRIHRSGRAFFVGPKPQNRGMVGVTDPPTILLMSRRPEEWSEFHSHFLQPLAFRFSSEADRFGVRLWPVLVDKPTTGHALFPAGREEVQREIQRLGKAFLGTVVLTMRRHFPGYMDWLHWLEGYQRPVVWLQDDDPSQTFPPVRKLVRLSFGFWDETSQESPAELAVKTLASHGHRHLGLACNEARHRPWVVARAAKLDAAAKLFSQQTGNPVTLHTHLDFQSNVGWSTGVAAIRRAWPLLREHPWPEVRVLAAKEPPLSTEAWEAWPPEDRDFLEDALLLGPLLRDKRITALIAPNDPMACRQFSALRRAGFAIPGDYSMLSFDNRSTLRPYPISSMEFGLDELGYRAFHLLFGAMQQDSDRRRNLRGVNRIIDHGSIGPPREAGSAPLQVRSGRVSR